MKRSEVESRLLELKQYRHDGARVPHKPLLVLLALERLTPGDSRGSWLRTYPRPTDAMDTESSAYPACEWR